MATGAGFARGLAIAVPALAAMAGPLLAQEPEIVVQAPSARLEIERILYADNLDLASMSPRAVANAIAQIPRGTAPDDFWASYRRHVAAWQRLAEASDRSPADLAELLAHERAINVSFDEVERIALRYGARMPNPH